MKYTSLYLIIICSFVSTAPIFCAKINVAQMIEAQKLEALALRAQNKAIQSSTPDKKIESAIAALHSGFHADRLGSENTINVLLRDSASLFKQKTVRNGVRKEVLKKDKKSTLRSKEFNDLRRLALMKGKLTQAHEEILTPELQEKGMEHFVEALTKMNKVTHMKWQEKKQEIIRSAIVELGIAAKNSNNHASKQFYNLITQTQTK